MRKWLSIKEKNKPKVAETTPNAYGSALYASDAHESLDSIAAAVMADETGHAYHAALLINYDGSSHVFHYTGRDVAFEESNTTDVYYCKTLDFIEPILIPSYLAQCEAIFENAQPRYGYFYCGALYDTNGDFVSPGNLPQYMTCVGFCLSVLKGFQFGEDFIAYDDWDEATLKEAASFAEEFLQKIKRYYPNVDLAKMKRNIRRIWPIEYLTSAYSAIKPVRKAFTDGHQSGVKEAVREIQFA